MWRRLSLVALLSLTLRSLVLACPSCMQAETSLSDDLEHANAVVVADPVQPGGNRYRVTRVLRGKLEPGRVIVASTSAFRKPVLIATTQSEGLPMWSGQPRSAESVRVIEFARAVLKLPSRQAGKTSGAKRLEFFRAYLGDPEKQIADSAYAELAAAPYPDLRESSRRVGQARLKSWLQSDKTPEEYRSLYLTMLSHVPGPKDAAWLRKEVQREVPTGSTPALLFAYVQVAGASGLKDLQRGYLGNDLIRRMMGVQALRVLLAENPSLRQSIFPLLYPMLKDIRLSGALIRDLAIYQDWSCAERIEQIMGASDTYGYVRYAALRYLISCPRPEIRARVQKLRKEPPAWCSSWPPPFEKGNAP
jgi:hypothetical protein